MRIEHLIYGLILFAFVMVTGVSLYAEVISNYDLDESEDALRRIGGNETLEGMKGISSDLNQDVIGKDVATDSDDSNFLSGIIPAITNIFTSVVFATKAISNIARETGIINSNLSGVLVSLLLTTIAVFAIYMFWRFKPSKD